MSFPYFDPHPGELLWGAMARLWHRMGLGRLKTFQQMALGSENIQAVPDLPANLRTFAGNLSPDSYSADDLIECHTLYPIYACFLGEERAKRLKALMLGNEGPRIHASAGISAAAVKQPLNFRMCPACAEEQKSNWKGLTWWLREHQIAGVNACARHGTQLRETPIAWRHRRTRQVFVSPLALSDGNALSARPEQVAIARLAGEILSKRPILDRERLSEIFRETLQTRGYLTKKHHIRGRLADDLAEFFGDEFLASIQSSTSGKRPGWLVRMLHWPQRNQAPIRYLMVMVYLEVSLLDYFSERSVEIPGEITKVGVWKAKPVDWTTEMDGKLSMLWADPKVSLRQISRTFSVDPMTVKRRAQKLKLGFPRLAVRPTMSEPRERRVRDLRKETAKRRTTWLRVWHQHPGLSRTFLRQQDPATYAWLYRNDRQWLTANQPLASLAPGRPGRRVNWAERDRRLSEEARRKICELLASDFGGRVSACEVSRQLQSESVISRKPEKLPRTVKLLAAQCESRMSYALRRIRRHGPNHRVRSDLLQDAGVLAALERARR